MLLLGIDLGTSAVKASVVDIESGRTIASTQFPDVETPIISLYPGWAEQVPNRWWQDVIHCIQRLVSTDQFRADDVAAIGIAYQMHGLVVTDVHGEPLRNSIIWCDSRAIAFGDQAFDAIGHSHCFHHLLNAPGNFTAAKLAWVKHHEPAIYEQVHKAMLPGDYIGYKLTGALTTTPSAMSEGVFWDFQHNRISPEILKHFGFSEALFPDVKPVFSIHGYLQSHVAALLGLKPGIPVSYKAGDQPNNALALNVLQPGEIAATAGTSGVIYGVTDQRSPDPQSRLNGFAHVNHSSTHNRIGLLLCINGCGIMNRISRDWLAHGKGYHEINSQVEEIPIGSNGVVVLPFGNGAERMLGNKMPGAQYAGLDLNRHSPIHLLRATQEGIAFAFRYGFDMMKELGLQPTCIRAGIGNMFQSQVFAQAFVEATGAPLELYERDSASGAAIGAGIGAGFLKETDAGIGLTLQSQIEPQGIVEYEAAFNHWKTMLASAMNTC